MLLPHITDAGGQRAEGDDHTERGKDNPEESELQMLVPQGHLHLRCKL